MGGSASRGRDNESLIDSLLKNGPSLPPDVERAMRLVDRGDYLAEKTSRAYIDLAWRSGSLHLSAPSIYVAVLRNLQLAPGQHFLNIGSGSGYLSTIVGLILGFNGINHGIEVNESNVLFANQRLETFLLECDGPCERDFCIPKFVVGNIFDVVSPAIQPELSRNEVRTRRISEDRSSGDDEQDDDAPEHMFTNDDDDLPPVLVNGLSEYNTGPDSSEITANESSVDTEARMTDETPNADERRTTVTWNGVLNIEPPPLVNPHELVDGNNDVTTWPMYDRIYVGGAIRNRTHLQSILRLLKVGGILVAPVQDELVQITRLSENRISRVDLLSVSFAHLVLPGSDASNFVKPPPKEGVPSLLRLCGHLLRRILRAEIERRHNGLPTLGRLEEVETDVNSKKRRSRLGSVPSVEQRANGLDASGHEEQQSSSGGDSETESGGDDHPTDEDTNVNGTKRRSTNPSEPDDETSLKLDPSESLNRSGNREENGGMTRLLHHLLLRSWLPPPDRTEHAQAGPSHPDTNEDHAPAESDSAESSDRVLVVNLPRDRSHDGNSDEESRLQFRLRVAERLLSVLGAGDITTSRHDGVEVTCENHEQEASSEPATTNVSVTEGATPVKRHSKQVKRRRELRYRPPSYRFRDEMRKMMSDELNLTEYFIQDAFIM
ncbi:uncharacterized protein DEA37_0008486 [Paragonimus westermani]|uniref:Protein-L-isoaspartate(D-aspartate) O-methyltransferase n=1 Tax=Paragonimus westermani TaxID=34504 RepID=A0A5J4NRQ8_9TREM|nr:uncharacterized protein DEA37_0008486 [Paragonimus westermani]